MWVHFFIRKCFFSDLFGLCPPVCYAPPRYVMRPPVTEHVPLNSKSLFKNMARASGGANNMRPLSWGGGGAQTEKIPFFFSSTKKWDLFRLCPPVRFVPPSTFCASQLQSTCHYIVNHYVKIWHVRLGVQIICAH